MKIQTKVVKLGKEAYVGIAWTDSWDVATSAVMMDRKSAEAEAREWLHEKLSE